MDYRKLYHILFNAATDAVNALDEGKIVYAKDLLISAQLRAEEIYTAFSGDEQIVSFPGEKNA